jgi:HD-GYP domain-containing protein (c-di-GMP phosphodiesterase class II)
MRLMPIHLCRPGMKLGKSIYNEEGLVLLGVHVELTQSLLNRLLKFGISQIYIEDAHTDDIIVPDMITDETRTKAMSTIRTGFRKMMEDSTKRRGYSNSFLGKDFRNVMTMIMDDLSTNPNAMIMLMDISVTDHYLYQHSLNVCIYATMLGMAYGYSRDELMTLGLGALLHDIGKTRISLEVLMKPGKLTPSEYEEIKKHTEYGYLLLKDEPNIPLLAAHCAFQHHERLDGSGYPRGIRGDEVHEYAQWLGLVDSYDAMTTHRVYRETMLPHQALEILFTGANTLYDHRKVALFRDKVAIYPLGVTVTLNTGETGVVVDINSTFPQRPIVRILQDRDGQDLNIPYEIDLSKNLTAIVVSVNDMKVEHYA